MNAKRPRKSRGQSLVLGALCLLVVVLMAMMTLGIGQRVREKMELQTLADSAAATDATMVARTFNEIALSNRGIVGDMVAMAATFSLTSYTTLWAQDVEAAKSALSNAQSQYSDILADCANRGLPSSTPICACAAAALADPAWGSAQNALDRELGRLGGMPLDILDGQAALQANEYRNAALSMHLHARHFLEDELSFEVSPYQVAKTLAIAAHAEPGELKVPLANDAISLREVYAANVDTSNDPEHHELVDVGRGTRYPFVLARDNDDPLNARFAVVLGGVGGIRITAHAVGTADWVAGDGLLKSEDRAVVTASYTNGGAACGGASGSAAAGQATLTTAPSSHVWPRGNDSDPHRHELMACETAPGCQPPPPPLYDYGSIGTGTDPPDPECHQPKCQRTENLTAGSMPRLATAAGMAQAMSEQVVACQPCPGVWPSYLGYQHGCRDDSTDLFCQPKQYAIVQRDYAARAHADPWNLAFRFRFAKHGDGSSLDLKRLALRDGTDISRQTAVAGGLAYYHYRGGAGWAETPNLMNPFWRSTLAPMDVDAAGNYRAVAGPGMDIPNFFLQSVNPAAQSSRSAAVLNREVFLELMRNGYRGGL